MIDNDLYIVEKLKKGDDAAFKVIYNHYFPRLYYFILEFFPSKDIAENIVQDTFLILWNKRQDLNDDTNLAAYLYTIAKNNCLQGMRNLKYRRQLLQTETIGEKELKLNIETLTSLNTDLLTFQEIEKIIQDTLAELPPQCRRVFELSRFSDMKNAEIAKELDISVKAVEAHITKGLKKIQNYISRIPTCVIFFLPQYFHLGFSEYR